MEAIMGASLGQILGYLAGAIAALSVFIEFVPVKINPVSSFLNWIGERTNRGLLARVDELEKKVDALAESQTEMGDKLEEKNAINYRVRILRFSDELRLEIKHSKESFDQALADIDEYEQYCDKHPGFKNNRTIMAKTMILDAYSKCMEKDSFL